MAKTTIVTDDTFGEGWAKLNVMQTELYSATETNTEDIATNTGNIATNAGNIVTNGEAISALEIDTAQISLNTAAIELNTAKNSYTPNDPGEIGLTVPGIISSFKKETYILSSEILTTRRCAGTIISNYGVVDGFDITVTLPPAAEGFDFLCVLPVVRAYFFRLECPLDQSDKINLLTAGEWVAGDDDGYVGVESGYSANDTIRMYTAKVADGGFEWFAIPIAGTWVAGNP